MTGLVDKVVMGWAVLAALWTFWLRDRPKALPVNAADVDRLLMQQVPLAVLTGLGVAAVARAARLGNAAEPLGVGVMLMTFLASRGLISTAGLT